MNELMNTNTARTFKNARLNEITAEINSCGKSMNANTVQIAKLLGEALAGQLYTDDGFKSVGEYAEQTFGIGKASAYQLANVGKRFYLAETATAALAADMYSPAKLAELVKLDDEQIQNAIDSGAISAASTQAQLRETAKSAKDTRPAVVKKYAGFCIVVGKTVETVKIDKADLDTIAKQYGDTGVIVKTMRPAEKDIPMVIAYFNPATAVFGIAQLADLGKPKAATKASAKAAKALAEMTDEEIAAYLAARRAAK